MKKFIITSVILFATFGTKAGADSRYLTCDTSTMKISVTAGSLSFDCAGTQICYPTTSTPSLIPTEYQTIVNRYLSTLLFAKAKKQKITLLASDDVYSPCKTSFTGLTIENP